MPRPQLSYNDRGAAKKLQQRLRFLANDAPHGSI